jgi:hypothetical protein
METQGTNGSWNQVDDPWSASESAFLDAND